MEKLKSSEGIKKLIEESSMAIVYFTGMDCGACEAIKYKIEMMLKKYPEIKSGEISGEENPREAASYGVFSLPVCLVFTMGKEALRIGRNVDLLKFEKDIDRYYEMIF